MQVPSQPLSIATGGVVKPSVAQKAVKGKSSAPKYRVPVRRSEGKIMSKKTIKQAKGVIEEYNDYRFKMLEVHEQFLQMQSDANRLFERMVFDDNQAILSAEPEIEYSPIEYSEAQYEATETSMQTSAPSVAANKPQPQPQAFTQSMAKSELLISKLVGQVVGKVLNRRSLVIREKMVVCCRLCSKQTKSSPLQLRVLLLCQSSILKST